MKVYVVWRAQIGPIEVFTTLRRAEALKELLTRDGLVCFVSSAITVNAATPEPELKI